MLSPKPDARAIPLFDLKSVTYSSGAWNVSLPLTGGMFRSNMGIGADCSIGNPDSDGTHLVAIVQDTQSMPPIPCASGGTATANPGSGTYYDVMFCNSISSLSISTCKILGFSVKSSTTVGAFLDPHIDLNGTDVYISERNSSQFPSESYNYWSIDDFKVNWEDGTTGPPQLTASLPVSYVPGSWTGNEITLGCEEFFKATSYQHLDTGVTRIFTQEDQVTNYPVNPSATTCSQIGRDIYSTGIAYFDLSGTTGSGATLTQIYPNPLQTPSQFPNCQTAAKNPACYAEFPIIVPTGDHLFMLFIGLTSTPAALIDLCTSPCKGNFPSETLTMDLGGNTQMPTIGAVIRQSDFQVAGTALDEEFLAGGLISGNYGNCAHLSLNTSLMQVVCDVRTSITNQADRTVIFPEKYAGSMLFPSSLIEGSVKINGNAKLQ